MTTCVSPYGPLLIHTEDKISQSEVVSDHELVSFHHKTVNGFRVNMRKCVQTWRRSGV